MIVVFMLLMLGLLLPGHCNVLTICPHPWWYYTLIACPVHAIPAERDDRDQRYGLLPNCFGHVITAQIHWCSCAISCFFISGRSVKYILKSACLYVVWSVFIS